jgi:hypothetical protein
MAWWTASIAAFALLVSLQFLLSFALAAAVRRFVLAFLAAGGALIIVLGVSGATITEAWAALAWFAFCAGLYVFGFTLSQSSISVKILQLLRAGPLARSELAAIYSPGHMVEKRFDRLLAARLIMRDGDGLRLSGRGRILLGVFGIIRQCCHARAGD